MRAFVVVFLLVALITTLAGFSAAAPLSYVLLAVGVACYGWAAGILLVEHLKEQRGTLQH
jgi:hypothetical protein